MAAEPVAPATLADHRKRAHISYSAIRTYLMCPMKYFHAYVARTEPSHRPAVLVFGAAIHEALAAYYAHVKQAGEKLPENEMLDVFRAKMTRELDAPIPIRFDDDDNDGAKLIERGMALLRTFWAQADCPHVLAVEQPFAVPLFDPATGEVFPMPLVGAIDLVIQGVERIEIVEHKTASKRYAAWQMASETQPSVYAYAARTIGLGAADLRYQVLVKTKTPSIQQCPMERTDRHIREMMATFTAVLRAVNAGIFYRNRSWSCDDCPYAYRCDEV